MLKVGLTGGIASGKSTVARMLVELGAHLVDTDVLARQAMATGSEGLREIERIFGPGVIASGGALDRGALREVVFNDAAKREELNKIVHPRVRSLVDQALKRIEARDPGGVALVDVPLLFEVGWRERFECTVLVYVPARVQVERLMARDHVDEKAAAAALNAQLPIEDKRRLADFLVDNSGPVEETRKQVKGLWVRLEGLAAPAESRKNTDLS